MSGIAEFFSMLRDIAATIGGGIAAYVALKGLSTWRRQLKGNAEYDAARKLILRAYKVRDGIDVVRAPGVHSMETAHALLETGIRTEGMDERMAFRAQMSAVYELRWRRVQEAKNELRLNALEARALWGDEAESAFREVNGCIQELRAAIVVDMEFKAHDVREEPADLMARKRILWPMATKPEDDEYMVRLNAAVARIEKLAGPHLKPEGA